MPGAGQGRTAQRAKRALSQANAGLQTFLRWYGASGPQIRGYARHALRIGRFIINAALVPQILLCISVASGVTLIALALPRGPREAHIIAALLSALLSANFSLRMARLAGQELAEDLRYVLRESPELADRLRGLLAGRQGRARAAAAAGLAESAAAPAPAAGETVSLSLGIFLRALRLAGKGASAAGQLAVPGLLDLSRLPFWLAFGGSILLAWLPFVFAAQLTALFGGASAGITLPDAALPPSEIAGRLDSALLVRSSLSFLCSSLACLPPLGMLVVLLVVRRAAAYIGIAEALLDVPEG